MSKLRREGRESFGVFSSRGLFPQPPIAIKRLETVRLRDHCHDLPVYFNQPDPDRVAHEAGDVVNV